MELTKCIDLAAREDFYFVSDDWWHFNETGRSVGCTATAIFRPRGKGSRINQKKKMVKNNFYFKKMWKGRLLLFPHGIIYTHTCSNMIMMIWSETRPEAGVRIKVAFIILECAANLFGSDCFHVDERPLSSSIHLAGHYAFFLFYLNIWIF